MTKLKIKNNISKVTLHSIPARKQRISKTYNVKHPKITALKELPEDTEKCNTEFKMRNHNAEETLCATHCNSEIKKECDCELKDLAERFLVYESSKIITDNDNKELSDDNTCIRNDSTRTNVIDCNNNQSTSIEQAVNAQRVTITAKEATSITTISNELSEHVTFSIFPSLSTVLITNGGSPTWNEIVRSTG